MPEVVQAQVRDVGFATRPLKRPCDHRAIEVWKEGIRTYGARPGFEHGSYGVIDRNDPPLIIFRVTQSDRPPA